MPAMNLTVVGNLTDDPELRYTPTGQAVMSFTVANNERYRDQSGEWKDGATSFVRGHIWREAAERAVESLHKGDRVVAVGTLRARTYEATDGSKRTAWELVCQEIAASTRYATLKITRASRDNVPTPEDPWSADQAKGKPQVDAQGLADDAGTEPPF